MILLADLKVLPFIGHDFGQYSLSRGKTLKTPQKCCSTKVGHKIKMNGPCNTAGVKAQPHLLFSQTDIHWTGELA